MGDRSNIEFIYEWPDEENAKSIFLYSHWDGSDLAVAAQAAMASETARDRWTDPAYFTRIVTQRVLNVLADPDSSTDHGLAPYECDNEHPILRLYTEAQRVGLGDWAGSYDEFVALSPEIVRQMAE